MTPSIEPHDVLEAHVGGGQERLQIVERQLDLRAHVVGMLRITVCIHRILPAANEHAPLTADELGLVETQLTGQAHGLIAWRSMPEF